jgi:AcrR family transcriptional regulator
MTNPDERSCRGRKRDASIDTRVLEVANRHLAERGFAALSIAAVADEACTTRQALYRRWPTKASLVFDAIQLATERPADVVSDDPRRDLQKEVERLLSGTAAGRPISLGNALLQTETPEEARECYRTHVMTPSRERIVAILGRAQRLGLADADADVDAAAAMIIGSAYVAAISGAFPGDWAARMTALAWRAVGGTAGG